MKAVTLTEETVVQTMHRGTDILEFSTWTGQCIDDVLGMARLRRGDGEEEMASQEDSRQNN